MVKRAAPYVTPETLPSRTAAWLEEVRSATRPRPQLRLEPRRCALLVIDLIRYFACAEGQAYLPAAAAVTPRILELVELWRRHGGPVVFTRHWHDGPEDLGTLGRFYSSYIAAGPESELIPALRPRADDAVLRKRTYDAFVGTELEGLLRTSGASQVLITGVLTHLCCETTARAAFVRGFEVYFAADATATSAERFHLGTLAALADGFAVVHSVEEVRELCPGYPS